MSRERSVARLVALVSAAVLGGGCTIDFSNAAEAHDQWKRTYTLTQPGSFQLRDSNGRIQIDAADGNTIEVVADRTVRAASDDAAKDALAHLEFTESSAPDHVSIDSSTGFQSMMFGKSLKTEYHIRVPKWAAVTVDTSNGDVTATGIEGALRVSATNGRIRGSALAGAASVKTTNGAVTLDFAKLDDGDITCDTTNGEISVGIPADAKARISARVTNGSIRW